MKPKASYKFALKQREQLLFLTWSKTITSHYLTTDKSVAESFPSLREGVVMMMAYCDRVYMCNSRCIPMVVIKEMECPVVLSLEENHDQIYNQFDVNTYN